jgi:hypothetical protein
VFGPLFPNPTALAPARRWRPARRCSSLSFGLWRPVAAARRPSCLPTWRLRSSLRLCAPPPPDPVVFGPSAAISALSYADPPKCVVRLNCFLEHVGDRLVSALSVLSRRCCSRSSAPNEDLLCRRRRPRCCSHRPCHRCSAPALLAPLATT